MSKEDKSLSRVGIYSNKTKTLPLPIKAIKMPESWSFTPGNGAMPEIQYCSLFLEGGTLSGSHNLVGHVKWKSMPLNPSIGSIPARMTSLILSFSSANKVNGRNSEGIRLASIYRTARLTHLILSVRTILL